VDARGVVVDDADECDALSGQSADEFVGQPRV